MFSLITLIKAFTDVFGWKVHLEVGLQTCVSCELIDLITTLEDYLGRTLSMYVCSYTHEYVYMYERMCTRVYVYMYICT